VLDAVLSVSPYTDVYTDGNVRSHSSVRIFSSGRGGASIIGRRIAATTAEPRSVTYFSQRFSVAIQRDNATSEIILNFCSIGKAQRHFQFGLDLRNVRVCAA